MSSRPDRRLALWAAALAVVAAGWRLHLRSIYFGSEEEDYGNLGLILGTLQSGFRYIETEHMPLFTTIAGLVTGITQNAESGGEIVAVLAGTAAVVLTLVIGWRWFSPLAGVLAACALAVQPDAALYSATPLRIGLYGALVLGGVLAAGERRNVLGGVLLSLAFLTRFDAAFTLLPALVLLAAWRRDGHRPWIPVVLLACTVAAWATYYHHEFGTPRFWGDVAQRNEGAELGWGTVLGFVGRIVPMHAGPLFALAAPAGLVLVLRERAERPLWLALAGASVFGFLLLTVFLSGYDWNHNLYWKWMTTSIPFLLLLGAHGLATLCSRLGSGRGPTAAVVALLGVTCGLAYTAETRSQLARSDQWYGTQVRLMRWVEAEFPDDVGVLADLIPATWLSRTTTERRVFLWRQAELPDADPEAFATFVRENRISLVFWFREEWVGAQRMAPWLSDPQPREVGGLRLLPVAAEAGYGFVAWQVVEPGWPDASMPPPLDAGATSFVRPR